MNVPETQLLPGKVTYRPGEPIGIELRGDAAPAELRVFRLGEPVAHADHGGGSWAELPGLPEGCYGVELHRGTLAARTAVEVRKDPRARLRYGFTVDYSPERDGTGLSDTVRRLHLTGVQFYDWAYRHADLLGGGESYLDALGQPVSLATVRRLVQAVQECGASALGYAAVYAVGPEEWPVWRHRAVLQGDGRPFALGDFLFLLDPAAPDWLEHFAAELSSAITSVGFDGFHLDQYGYPKAATRHDGVVIDMGESFERLLGRLRDRLPAAHLVFNNVNDFPTWRTAPAAQDAVYIEPWEPQTTLGALARTVTRARGLGGGKPVILAAYQHVYDAADAAAADRATRLTMATLFSHGATQLLAGEADRILVDPYYVRNHVVAPSTAAMLTRWYDFLVEHDELLIDPDIVEVTNSVVGDYNGDLDVTFDEAPTSTDAIAGRVWRRVTQSSGGASVVHLINLAGQDDTDWDAPRRPFAAVGGGTLRVRRLLGSTPRVRIADPDGFAMLTELPVTEESGGTHVTARLPELSAWQVVVVDRAAQNGASS